MSLFVVKAGAHDTLQDAGRMGYAHMGINHNGAMDLPALFTANALVANPLRTVAIEFVFPAPVVQFNADAIIALSGADFGALLNDKPLPILKTIIVKSGSTLRFSKPLIGRYGYLALYGGFNVPSWLGSQSTNVKIGMGGYNGRRLQNGDVLDFITEISLVSETKIMPWFSKPGNTNTPIISVLAGPEWDWLSPQAQTNFLHQSFRIQPQSDRMGILLQAHELQKIQHQELLSSGVANGTVQLLPNGQLIVLMADRQTTGGYPRIATVAGFHLGNLAQAASQSHITFALTSPEEAEGSWITLYNDSMKLLQAVKWQVAPYIFKTN